MYYFAGDYADLAATPSPYQYTRLDELHRLASRLQYEWCTAFLLPGPTCR
ncbi:MAG: hypothetical protein U5K84_06320 [Alkalibacterium sp.]|nr:hypothetical protein [Alkalibacterium sp.]